MKTNTKRKHDISKFVFVLSSGFVIFLLGGFFASQQLQPYQVFEDGYKAAGRLYDELTQTRPSLLEDVRYEGDGVTRYRVGAAYPGVTVIQGLFPEGPGLRLLDMDGREIHRWAADFFTIWPDPVHVPPNRIPIDYLHYHIQGMWLLPDASAVISFGELGTAKLDKCGNVQWTLDRSTHHSVTPNADGSFWIPAKGQARHVPGHLLLGGISADTVTEADGRYEDRLLLVESDGTIRKEFSVLRALLDREEELAHELYDMGVVSPLDPTHVNDIEVVTPALARRIDSVEAGDLLVSIRQRHMLAILDAQTGAIKWRHSGPWVRQHDPDITDEGLIEVFSNGADSLPGSVAGVSSIISLDPATGETKTLYPQEGQQGFYTRIMGRHQLLPNGNRMIIESLAGRVFEIDPAGNIVWEYVKRYDDTHAALIEDAIRYDERYFTVESWECPAAS